MHPISQLQQRIRNLHRATVIRIVSMLAVVVGAGYFVGLAQATTAAPAAMRNLSGCTSAYLGGNDDGSTGAVPLGFTLNLFGTPESSAYVNNNGNITFDGALRQYTPEDLTVQGDPIFAPFFADVYTEGASTDPNAPNANGLVVFYGAGQATQAEAPDHVGQKYFCVNWNQVGYFSGGFDKLNAFQLVIWDKGPSTNLPGADNFAIEFNYNQVQWETGDADNGTDGLGGDSPAVVGWTNGSGIPGTNQQLQGSGIAGSFLDVDPATELPGADSLVGGSLNSSTPGRYVWQLDNGVAPAGGIVSGRVFDLNNTVNGVQGARVAVCPVQVDDLGAVIGDAGFCHNTLSGTNGAYSVSSLPKGWYTVAAFPADQFLQATSPAVQLTWIDGDTPPTVTQDLGVSLPIALPENVNFPATYGTFDLGGVTVPRLHWGSEWPFTATTSCTLAGAPRFTLSGQTLDGTPYTATLPLTQDVEGPVWTGVIPVLEGLDVHGPLTVTPIFTCENPLFPALSTDPVNIISEPFTVYIDPSGTVVDQHGNLVQGATVTLLSSDDPANTFVAVPDGSTVMSVDNRTNPQTTLANGVYGWDVIPGFYKVLAHKDGCLDYTSDLLTIPPAVTGLTLTLQCGGASIITPTVTVTGGSLQYGQGGTFTATLSQTVPASLGAIQFKVDGVNLGSPVALANGSATSPNLSSLGGFPLAAGSHGVEADYVPTDVTKFGAAIATAGFVVNKAASSTQLALQGSSAVATLSAVAPGSGTPTGAVSFTRDGVAIGTAQLSNGVATLTGLAAGAGNVAATYAGDSNFTGSSGSTARQMPTIVATVTSRIAKTSFGWYRSPVTVSFTCTANGSPLAGGCPAPVTLASSGAAQSVTRTILAQDGGAATAVVNGINIDRGRPRLWVQGVVNNHHYTSAPHISCVGEDTLSGIASCTVTAGRASHGVVHYTATATDKAGNVKTVRGFYFLSH